MPTELFNFLPGEEGTTRTGELQTFVVPATVCTVTIQALGARGGNYTGSTPDRNGFGGIGASVSGCFCVTPGETLTILVAAQGQDTSFDRAEVGAGSGGGGGSFVWRGSGFGALSPASLLVAAGGGGGAGGRGVDGQAASLSDEGGSGGDSPPSTGGTGGGTAFAGSGGVGSGGGTSGIAGSITLAGGGGGGGGGTDTDGGGGGGAGLSGTGGDGGQGAPGSKGGGGGTAITNMVFAGFGGRGGVGPDSSGGFGGFGGGGGGGGNDGVSDDGGGGGGGGFAGGGGGAGGADIDIGAGGGGGSIFNAGANQVNGLAPGGTVNGSVIITYDLESCPCSCSGLPCTITCPGDFTVFVPEGSPGTTATYPDPITTGICGTVTCSPASGSFFPVGATVVTCSSSLPEVTPCSFTITVAETALPCTIICPADIRVTAPAGTTGAIVEFPAPTTSGACGTVTCTPASGSFFPIGTTIVTCSPGVTTTPPCTFTVTVDPEESSSANGTGAGLNVVRATKVYDWLIMNDVTSFTFSFPQLTEAGTLIPEVRESLDGKVDQ